MSKKYSKILHTIEYILYAIIIGIVVSGQFSDIFSGNNGLAYGMIIIAVILLLTGIAASFMWGNFLDHPRTILLYSIFISFAISTSSLLVTIDDVNYSPFIMLLSFLTIIYSSRGVLTNWLISISVFIANIISSQVVQNDGDYLSTPGAIMVLIAATSVFVASLSKRRALDKEAQHRLTEEVVKSRVSNSSDTGAIKTLTPMSISGDPATQTTTFAIGSEELNSTEKELEGIVFFIEQIFKSHTTLAFIYDANREVFILSSAKSKSMQIANSIEIPKGSGVVGEIAVSLQAFTSGNLTLYTKDLGYYKGNEAVASLLAVPILSNEKELLGALVIDSQDKLAYRDNHRDILGKFAKTAAELIINIRMRKAQEINAARSAMLFDSAQIFAQSDDNLEIISQLISFIKKSNEISRVTAVAFDPETSQSKIINVDSATNEIVAGYTFTSTDSSFIGRAVKTQQYQYSPDFQQSRSEMPLFIAGENLNNQIRSVLVIPFAKTGANYKIVITIESYKPSFFNHEFRNHISIIVNSGAMAYEKAVLYKQMQQLATTDGLTKLCNHRTFQEQLHDHILHSHRYERPLSVLLMDIDHFKNFNDTYGHQIGDEVLRVLANALRASVRTSDIPARYGGEEFVVVLPETDVENAFMMAERIRTTIEKAVIPTQHGDLKVTVSVGAATLNVHATTQEQLINCADAAMYASKKTGRNRSTLYEEGMENEIA